MKRVNPYLTLSLSAAAIACAPSQFRSSNDLSSQVKTKPAGFADAAGRVNLDCQVASVDGNRFNQGQKPTALGIPMNCPKSLKDTTADTVSKFDVAIVLDVSENMMELAANIKPQLVQVLTKLVTDGKLGSLSAVSFRTNVVASVSSGDVTKLISEIGGSAADWNPNGFKKIESNSTEWITNEAAKAVFSGISEAVKHLEAGSNVNKLLLVVSGSTGTGDDGRSVGPTAKLLSEFSSRLSAKSGQLVLNYAANKDLARGLSQFDPSPIEHLDLLSSTAGLNPLRVLIPADISGWSVALQSRTVTSAAGFENCPLASFEASDASGQMVFKKDVPKPDLSGIFEASLPAAVPTGKLVLKINRTCVRTGIKSQTVNISLAQGGASK